MLKKILVMFGVSSLVGAYLLVMHDSNVPSQATIPAQYPKFVSSSASSFSVGAPSAVFVSRNSSAISSSKNNIQEKMPEDRTPDFNSIAMKKNEDFSRYSQALSEKGVSLQDDLLEKFKNEPIDSEWAPLYENKIRDFFSETEAINRFVPDSVVCKTKKCQIQLHVANDQEISESAQLFNQALRSDGAAIQVSDVVVMPDFREKMVVFYITKDKESPVYQ